MCRKWFAKSACGMGDADGKLFVCADHEVCGPILQKEFKSKDFCIPCLKHLRTIAGEQAELYTLYALDEGTCQQVRQVLNLAVEPDERFVPSRKRFSGQLSELDGPRISLLTEFIGRYMAMPGIPEFTEEEMRLFEQLRVAELAFSLMHCEAELQLEEERGGNRVLQARLRTRMRPVYIPANQPDCPICFQFMSDRHGERNRAMALPCNHIFGRDCLEARIGEWKPGHSFHCCAICGQGFDMMTYQELAEGIDPLNHAGLPAAGPWRLPGMQLRSNAEWMLLRLVLAL